MSDLWWRSQCRDRKRNAGWAADGAVAVLDTIQREDFGGEDPLLPEARQKLEDAWQHERELEGVWANVGKALGAEVLDSEPWPPLPEPAPEREEFYRTRLLDVMRERE